MSQFLETIRIENGEPLNLAYHQNRLTSTQSYNCKSYIKINLEKIIVTPLAYRFGTVKCRIIYGQKLEQVSYEVYKPLKINNLTLIESQLDYKYKNTNRNELDELRQKALNLGADEVLIIKNGWITDTSYSNVAFFDGKNWVTPSTPLLKGTQRQFLLDKKIVIEKDITVENLYYFEKVLLINAMLGFDIHKAFSTKNIS